VTEVACWAHSRRRFYEAQSSDLMRSTVMRAYIRLLYDVEREARDMKLNGEKRLALRLAESVRILDDIKAYLERERPNVLPKSPEGQAISCALSNWKALTRYCEDADLEIDNNGPSAAFVESRLVARTGCFLGATTAGGRRPS
jgi:transposase